MGFWVFWVVANGNSHPRPDRHATTGRAVAPRRVRAGPRCRALLRPHLGVADPLPNDIFDGR